VVRMPTHAMRLHEWGTRHLAIFCALSFRMTLNLFGERSRPKINEVFTPRRTEVNREIYVDRLGLEKSLIRALDGSLHAIIFGESGSGKS
jgi:hypothetical protein